MIIKNYKIRRETYLIRYEIHTFFKRKKLINFSKKRNVEFKRGRPKSVVTCQHISR